MRPLTEPETQTLFAKLAGYTGNSLKNLIAPLDNTPNADRYVFSSSAIEIDKLLSLGICLGKFTKSGKFRIHITALPILAEHARYKVWVKANGEMPFLYGGHIVKAHVGRWSEDCPEHQGVVVYSMNDTPLGFGVTARSTQEARRLDPTGIVCFRQADAGEYLRDEDTLFATS
ncbi:hypothetical protein EYC84_001980 [Monilinia fructicola]|uniref:60S ribosome subunit biogenesis protein NIP7 n=1 Tax=Monilinia fructicola TaxID=38448 RepID=A0A5M9JZD0_MONFR|nr:hypothetical protein EYC84_001980 [Monilinia fructicola]